ncbi:MAG: ABC transporter ATP-binding protein, partial [Eubacteriales bacterium]|nr:ABC transporter ATP-binding protein [Eubacteriales bacterium]
GSGKSTVVNLIPRFYDIDSGEILIDGVNIAEMKQSELREKIGYVPQKAVLFSGTIADNLRFGNDDASDEQLERAAKIAMAYDFITEKSEGFNEPVSQGGTNISGGQKQRLSIARAIAKDPEIYIFDDSFSALDARTDRMLRDALRKEISRSTAIIVSQRVSTVMDADRIIVLNDGRMVGMGTHDELIQSNSIYREIVESQLPAQEKLNEGGSNE